jgi:hypothetical protein
MSSHQSEAPEMPDVAHGVVTLTTVAAKKPGHWIVRAFSPFTHVNVLWRCVREVVGEMDPEIEWSSHCYGGWPGYVVYGDDRYTKHEWPTGLYKYPHRADGTYGPGERLGDVR